MEQSNPPIKSSLGGELTPQQVRDARARALRYAFDRYFEKQKAAKISGGEKGSGERLAPRERDKDLRP